MPKYSPTICQKCKRSKIIAGRQCISSEVRICRKIHTIAEKSKDIAWQCHLHILQKMICLVRLNRPVCSARRTKQYSAELNAAWSSFLVDKLAYEYLVFIYLQNRLRYSRERAFENLACVPAGGYWDTGILPPWIISTEVWPAVRTGSTVAEPQHFT